MNARVVELQANEIQLIKGRSFERDAAVDRFRIINPLSSVPEGVKVPAKKKRRREKERKRGKGRIHPSCSPVYPLLSIQTTLELVIFDRLPAGEEIFHALDEIHAVPLHRSLNETLFIKILLVKRDIVNISHLSKSYLYRKPLKTVSTINTVCIRI